MRLIRKLRLLVLLAPVVAMLATATPADANTRLGAIVFVGAANLSTPLSYPCVGNPPPIPPSVTNIQNYITTSLQKCPVIGTKPSTVTVFNPVTGARTDVVTPVPIGGNNSGFSFRSGTCVGAAVTTKGAPVTAGSCGIFAAGTLTGSCGLSTGQGTATVTFAAATVTTGPPPSVTAQFAFLGIASTLVITGTAGPLSALVGVVEAIPVPDTTTIPPGNSCLAKTADDFTIAGIAAFVEV